MVTFLDFTAGVFCIVCLLLFIVGVSDGLLGQAPTSHLYTNSISFNRYTVKSFFCFIFARYFRIERARDFNLHFVEQTPCAGVIGWYFLPHMVQIFFAYSAYIVFLCLHRARARVSSFVEAQRAMRAMMQSNPDLIGTIYM